MFFLLKRDERLQCTLWGKSAQTVYNACEVAGAELVICIIRFARINVWQGMFCYFKPNL